ncbi:hypothetical protein JCM13580A_02180 [Streptomyces drozdowiczii]
MPRYIGDGAAVLATLGENPDGDGRVWHLPSAPALTTRRIMDLMGRRGTAGRRAGRSPCARSHPAEASASLVPSPCPMPSALRKESTPKG